MRQVREVRKIETLIREIRARLAGALRRLDAGDDLPPSMRLRLEGLCEAAVLTGAATERDIDAMLDTLTKELLGFRLVDELGGDWRCAHPFPELPLFARRAPVSPTTGA